MWIFLQKTTPFKNSGMLPQRKKVCQWILHAKTLFFCVFIAARPTAKKGNVAIALPGKLWLARTGQL
jgi:hypothetical protein